MKNKLFKLTALLVVVLGLAGCQKEVDVMGITNDLANKNLQGCYTYTALDSATMTTYKQECFITESATGEHIGYFRTCRAGQGATTDVKIPFTWVAEMAADHLTMKVTAKFEDDTEKQFVWDGGIIKDEDFSYTKSVSGLSDVDVQLAIFADLENTHFEHASTTFFKHLVKVDYLAWNTKVDRKSYAPEDTLAQKNTYLAQLEPYMDTIVWYIRTQVPEHTIGFAHLDTVINGTDTTYQVANLVYVEPTPNSAGKHLITYLVSTVKQRDDQVNDRPKTTISSVMEFTRVGDQNSAVYSYELHEWSEEFYTAPTDPKATVHDSISSFVASSWAIPTYTNGLKFDVLLFGKSELTEVKTEGGTETMNTHKEQEDVFQTLMISGYSKKKGEATLNDLKYTLKN